jgi:hypothetical protein
VAGITFDIRDDDGVSLEKAISTYASGFSRSCVDILACRLPVERSEKQSALRRLASAAGLRKQRCIKVEAWVEN